MSARDNPDRIGRYEVLARIGRGGMGTVYRALDPQIDRTVAIKILDTDNEELRARFRQEVRAAGTLTHPNIVTIHDFGEDNGRPFIVMEYIDGRPLSDLWRDPKTLTLSQKLHLAQQLCAALDYAHARDIVHRDIKPENLMVDRGGDLKVVDFGIARIGDVQLTRTGEILGTLRYMSPEQIEGHLVDRRADIFAVGAVLYELLSSRAPFAGDTPSQIMRAILNDQPIALARLCPELDPAFDRIVKRAMEKDPARRYPTLKDVSADLSRISIPEVAAVAAEAPTGTLLIDRGRTATSDSTTQSLRNLAAIAAVLIAVGLGAWWAIHTRSATGDASTSPTNRPTPPPADTVRVPVEPTTPPHSDRVDPISTPPEAKVPVKTPAITVSEPKPKPKPKPNPYEEAMAILNGAAAPGDLAKAAALLDEACTNGENGACLTGGRLYRDNTAVKNVSAATRLFQRACDAALAEGCNDLALDYARGVGVSKDDARAASLFERACDGGFAAACTSLARAYQQGRGVARNDVTSRAIYEKACGMGGMVGCAELGRFVTRGIAGPADPARAATLFQRACDANVVIGCGSLGFAYLRGIGVPQDDGRAAALYERACNGGGAPSCAGLADMYASGRAVPKDLARAATLYERACTGDSGEGCRGLADAYRQGLGVERNAAKAVELDRRATQLGAPPTASTGRASQPPVEPGNIVGGVAGGLRRGQPAPPDPPAPPPTAPIRIGRNIKPPTRTKYVEPVYPAMARSSRVQGVVIIEVVIGPEGNVTDAKVLRSIPLLDQAALDAVRQWQFTPTVLDGKAVPVLATMTVNFSLQ